MSDLHDASPEKPGKSPTELTGPTAIQQVIESEHAEKSRHPSVDDRSSGRIFFSVVLILLIVAGGYFGFRYLVDSRREVPQRKATERAEPIRVLRVTRATVSPILSLFGTIEPARSLDIRSHVPGEVIAMSKNLTEGGLVHQGEVLLQIDPFVYEGALTRAMANLSERKARIVELEARISQERTALESARVQATIAKRELERMQTLLKRQIVSEKVLEQSQTRLSQVQASADRTDSQIKVLNAQVSQVRAAMSRDEWEVKLASRTLANTRLRTPFDAYVNAPAVEVGRVVGGNDRIATLLEANSLEARLFLNDSQYGRLFDGRAGWRDREVEITWRRGDGTGRASGRLSRVAARSKSGTGGYEIYVSLDGQASETPVSQLRPGSFVEATMSDVHYSDVIALPESSLYEGNRIFRVKQERLEAVTVSIAAYTENKVLVRSDEIQNGDLVLITHLSTAGDGLRVDIQSKSAP